MSDQNATQNSKPAKPEYAVEKYFLVDGQRVRGEFPSLLSLTGFAFVDSAGEMSVGLDAIGIGEANTPANRMAARYALDALTSALSTVASAATAKANEGKAVTEIAREKFSAAIDKLIAGTVPGLQDGESAGGPAKYVIILAQMTNIDVAAAQAKVDARRAEMGEKAFKDWVGALRQVPEFKIAEAQYDLAQAQERAKAAGGKALDF